MAEDRPCAGDREQAEAIEEGLRDVAEGRVTHGPTALAAYLPSAAYDSDPELEDIQASKAEFARGEGVDGLAAINQYLTRKRKLSDDELEAMDVDSVFANADLSDPSADAADLRAVTAAYEALEQSRAALAAAVESARARGRSWARIGGLLGISRQAAQRQFQ